MTTVRSETWTFLAKATRCRLFSTESVTSTEPRASGPTAIFSAYMPTGARTSAPRSAVAMTETALGRPFATRVEPSIGLRATSQASPVPSPAICPTPSEADAWSSPITMLPFMCTPLIASHIALPAVARIPSRSRLPIQRPADRAAASVARTSSRPRFGETVRGAAMPPEEGVETSDFTR